MGVHVTTHAIERYQERVRNCPAAQAQAALSTPTIAKAAEFGACAVILGTGHRAIIENGCIVTVLSKPAKKRGRRV